MSAKPIAGLMLLGMVVAASGTATAQPVRAFAPTVPPSAESISPPNAANATPLSPEARADILMARKMYREAIDIYEDIHPQTHISLNKMGIAYHHMGILASAKKHYEKSFKANPKYPEAVNNLGTVFYAQKNYRKAIKCYRKALELSPSAASIHSNLGTAFFARKNYRAAAEEYETALKLDPEVFERRGTHGVLLQERSVEERAKFHYYLSKTYARSGQHDRALQYMRKSIEEGFKDKQKFREEDDFAKLRELPEFEEILRLEPRAL